MYFEMDDMIKMIKKYKKNRVDIMAEYFKLVSVNEGKYYSLGTISQAVKSLPRLLGDLKEDEIVIIYGDQHCEWIEDRYEIELEFEEVDYDFGDARENNKEIERNVLKTKFYGGNLAGEKITVKELRSTFQ